MRCPDCCAGITDMPKSDKSFYDWTYFVQAAKYFYGIERINFTGGEPSVHPQFEEFIPKLKELFGTKKLTVWTNGTMFKKKPEVWKNFDEIHVTNYTEKTFEGSPNNTSDIEFIREYLKETSIPVYSADIVHINKENRGTKMCFRGYSDTVEFVDGYIYPCCAASGLKTKVRLPLSENWRDEIIKLHPPCNECLFAEN
jgi:hypothetical protein